MALLLSASAGAMAVAQGAAQANGLRTFSPAWYAARGVAGRGAAGSPTSSSAVTSLRNVNQSLVNMARAASAIRSAAALQAQASQAASTANVANGLVPNGLVPGGLVSASGGARWTGALQPVQTGGAERPVVSVVQTAPRAVLTWQTFNVGARTTLAFDQSAGGSGAAGWVAINRVEDPRAEPSRILGAITAPGKVFVLNRNGVIFGGGSQVNVGGLLAAAADINDVQITTSGIFSATASDGTFLPAITGGSAKAKVLVEQGARIRANASSSVLTGGGSVLLFGGDVRNDGQIETPGGQTVLAAGRDFVLRPGYSVVQDPTTGALSGNLTSTTLGTEVTVAAGVGSVTNTGLITSYVGDVSLVGRSIVQNGVIVATTSVNQRGTVHLLTGTSTSADDTGGTVTLGGGSLTTVQLDASSASAFDTRRSGLIKQSRDSNALLPQSALPDRRDQSRIEITSDGLVDFTSESLTMAQGGRIAVTAGRRAFVRSGAVLDTSGVVGVTLPADVNSITVNIQPTEQRDAPVNRDLGLIKSNNVTLDIRDLVRVAADPGYSAPYDTTDRFYTRGGLLEVGGYINTKGHGIAEWASVGGVINISTPEFIAQPHSTLNVAGGTVSYQAGRVGQSWLVGRDGRLYNVSTAPADVPYVSVYGGEKLDHPRWGVTETYRSPLIAPTSVFRTAYIEGRDGGTILIQSPTAVLDGDVFGGVVTGARQVAQRRPGEADGYLQPKAAAPIGGRLEFSNPDPTGAQQALFPIDVRIAPSATSLAAMLTADSAIPTERVNTAWVTPEQIGASGLSSFSVVTAAKVQVLASTTFAPGGTIAITAPVTEFSGNLAVRSGTVVIGDGVVAASNRLLLQLDGRAGVTLHAGAAIDARGLWVNAYADPSIDRTGAGFVNGGSVSITSAQSVSLGAGSVVDVSAGAFLSETRGVTGVTGGTGGNLALLADTPFRGAISNLVTPGAGPAPNVPSPATLSLGGALRGYAVTTGGTLTLAASAIQIGAAAEAPPTGTLILPPEVATLGFSSVVLNGHQGVRMTEGTQLVAVAPTYQPQLVEVAVPTGRDIGDALPLQVSPLYSFDAQRARITQRQGVSLTLSSDSPTGKTGNLGGAILLGRGTSIAVDPRQSVTIATTGAQITALGTITAPSGTIALLQNAVASLDVTALPDRGLAIWVGESARLDVAGRAVSALDLFGRPYSTVAAPDGGSVLIGASGLLAADPAVTVRLPAAAFGYVAIRPGAVIDASGTAVVVDQLAGLEPTYNRLVPGLRRDPFLLAGSGGTIAMTSGIGISLDGTLLATAGAPQAGGGTLALGLRTPVTFAPTLDSGQPNDGIDPALLVPRSITISQTAATYLSDLQFRPGDAIPAAAIGQARLTPYQVAAGGFDTVALSSTDTVVFDSEVMLRTSNKIEVSALAVSQTRDGATARLEAPYVVFGVAPRPAFPASDALVLGRDFFYPGIFAPGGGNTHQPGILPATVIAGTLDVRAHYVQGSLQNGVTGEYYGTSLTPATVDLPSIQHLNILSTGDVRVGTIQTRGDLSVVAAQVIPFGDVAGDTLLAGGVLTIGRSTTELPPMPFEVRGRLALGSATIEQGGVVRAPFGQILLTGFGGSSTAADTIDFLPGSVTSVSAGGVSTLFGGTSDDQTYFAKGLKVDATAADTKDPSGLGTRTRLSQPSVAIVAQSVAVQSGAVIDLSGGGNIQGAAFISGRGGSTDTLLTPLLRFNGTSSLSSTAGNTVYAIVEGQQPQQGAMAPATTSAHYGGDTPLLGSKLLPALGQQIVLTDSVPGLPAGTYTLLPAYYALLPGGHRVELNPSGRITTSAPLTQTDGSVITRGYLAVATTGQRMARPIQVTLTSGEGVRARSQYDEETVTQFTFSRANKSGQFRGGIPADGGLLAFAYPTAVGTRQPFSFAGTARFSAGAGGLSGAVAFDGVPLSSELPFFEVSPAGATPTSGFVTLTDRDLSALGAPRLSIGGFLSPTANIGQDIGGPAGSLESTGAVGVVVRNGATLQAGEIFLVGSITLQAGSVVSSIGGGPAPYDSTLVGNYTQAQNKAALAVSNGLVRFAPATSGGDIVVENGATLSSEGSIAFATTGNLTLGQGVRYGARYIAFASNSVNVGSDDALSLLRAAGRLPTGVGLSTESLARLLAGDASAGVPALERLTITAANSLNFVGSALLDTTGGGSHLSTLRQFVLNTPAIYGAGGPGDVAGISVDTLYWNGIVDQSGYSGPRNLVPGGQVAGGPGSGAGTLEIRANRTVLGYNPDDPVVSNVTLDRVTFGFDRVNLIATDRIEGDQLGSLSVYRQQQGIGPVGTGGTLSLVTPLLTSGNGAKLTLRAGGAITLTAPDGIAPNRSLPESLGGDIQLSAAVISLASAVALPSGHLVATAGADISVGAGALLNVTGPMVTFFDQQKAGRPFGITLESSGGSVRVDPAANIDISAAGANAGSLVVTAVSGTVDLAGPIFGSSPAPFFGGTVSIRAGVIPDFTALNLRLNEGGVTGARVFDLRSGSLVIQDVTAADGTASALLRAHTIVLSVDGGTLTVDGRIDASGARPGTIRLAGAGGLDLTARAVLDAHATEAQVDSYGAPIDAENRASVSLTAGGPATGASGALVIAPGAVIDVSAAPGVTCLLGTAACGTVELNAPRLGNGDIAVSATGAITVSGARFIALNAMTHYVPANGTIVQTNLGVGGAPIDANAIGLDQIDAANMVFITAALPGGTLNGVLSGKLAGLTGPYAGVFHLRPGVEIDSPAAGALDPNGALYLPGDLDLSGLRYASLNAATRKTATAGSGEAGSLTVRASGQLWINGSLTDGFARPPQPRAADGTIVANPSDNGWIYTTSSQTNQGQEPFLVDVVLPYSLPTPIELPIGTKIPSAKVALGYDIAIDQATIKANTYLPQAVTLSGAVTLTRETVATARIIAPGPGLPAVYEKGQIIPAGTTLAAGATLEAGTLLSVPLPIAAGVWRSGGNLAVFSDSAVTLTQAATLRGGSLIPANTLVNDTTLHLPTRPTGADGVQGRVWGAAPLLPAGSESWSLRLVGGSDLAAADSRVLRPASTLRPGEGDVHLADTHYIVSSDGLGLNQAFSVVRTGTGDLDVLAGGSVIEHSLFGIYTAGTRSPNVGRTISGGVDTLDQGRNEFDLVRGVVEGSVLGPNGGVYESLVNKASTYAAYYPHGGGNVLLRAQGDVIGDIYEAGSGDGATQTDAVPNYLWRQGGGTAVDQSTAWWVNFGTYAVRYDARPDTYPLLVGFTGVGTLGGGNVDVEVGGNLGPARPGAGAQSSGGLDVAVVGTGRVTDGQVVQTGGGRLSISVGGGVNPDGARLDSFGGTWTNLRGDLSVSAGSIGLLTLAHSTGSADPRFVRETVLNTGAGTGGPALVLGDSRADIATLRDLTLLGSGDPTRLSYSGVGGSDQIFREQRSWNSTPFVYQIDGRAVFSPGQGNTSFSLWQPRTAIAEQSAGGNVVPFTLASTSNSGLSINSGGIGSFNSYLPGSLSVTALAGSIYLAPQALVNDAPSPFVLAPSPVGQLNLFAGMSIYSLTPGSASRAIDMSGASPEATASVLRPAFDNRAPITPDVTISNVSPLLVGSSGLFPFGEFDTPTGRLHANDYEPIRVYAKLGDIVGVRVGEALTAQPGGTGPARLYLAAKATQFRAGQDIVLAGNGANVQVTSPDATFGLYNVSGNFVLNLRPSDVSVVAAGRDVLYANFQVAGPGALLVEAGRNLNQGNLGVLESLGEVVNPDPLSRSGGATILAIAGVGAAGPDWTALASAYLNASNQAVTGTPLGQGVNAGRVARTYLGELFDWLVRTYGYSGSATDALATFQALPIEQQAVFLAPIYFDELRLSGREYSDPASVRYRSYSRGRAAIATLFTNAAYDGGVTLFTGTTTSKNAAGAGTDIITTDGGIRTDRGGSVIVLDPGGGVTVGVTGITPGAAAGLLTQGAGDIDVFSRDSVLLGQSRVFTTFGGGITIWSAQGDINAGRGSKTTVVSAPQQITYDPFGTALLSPTVPTTGAGIATLNPIPEVPAGDVDLIAPLGAIDAGEAGIRVSGNANLAALTIVNAANIQVQGKTTGVPTVAAPNLGALAAAQAASGSAQNAAIDQTQKRRRASETIITVDVLGFGP